jgi:hypothetical protein
MLKRIFCMMALLSVLSATAVQSGSGLFSFMPGEKLTYRLSWGFIPAGVATLEVMPLAEINGEAAYHFVMTARTNSFVDVFYKVRDRVDAYTDIDMNHSLLYQKKHREGDTIRDIEVLFDWQKQQAVYSNITAKEEKTIDLQPGTFDPLSAFYYSRLQALQKNKVVERPVSDGKKNLTGRLAVRKNQKISVSAGRFDTFLLEPDLKDLGGVFEKDSKAKLKLWVTSDPRHMLVKIKSKVVVGSFVAELIEYTPGTHPDKS